MNDKNAVAVDKEPIPKELLTIFAQKYGTSEDTANRMWTDVWYKIPKDKMSKIIKLLEADGV